jgi:bacterioferritin-associated ferredoxin
LRIIIIAYLQEIAMIVCVCRRISDKLIERSARMGMGFDEIQLEFGVATQCGQCETCARALVGECQRQGGVGSVAHVAHVHQKNTDQGGMALV